MIRGKLVAIRPVQQNDLDLLNSWVNNVEIQGAYNSFGLEGRQGLEAGFHATGLLDEVHGMLVITTLDNTVIGSMSYHQVHYGPNRGSRAYNIGLSLVPEARGLGYGTEAQQLLTAYLFDTYTIARVEASTDVTNLAEQRSLEKAGFTREGVLRKAQWRTGRWHDLMLYSKLRGE